jgi:hypothetical protein
MIIGPIRGPSRRQDEHEVEGMRSSGVVFESIWGITPGMAGLAGGRGPSGSGS